MMHQKKDNVAAQHDKYAKAYAERDIYNVCIEGTLELRKRAKEFIPPYPAEPDDDYAYPCTMSSDIANGSGMPPSRARSKAPGTMSHS